MAFTTTQILYAAKTLRGVVEMDTWTGIPLMIHKDYRRLCVYPLDLFDNKVIMYPADSSRTSFLVVHLDAPLFIKSVNASYYPKADNVVRVRVNMRTLLVLATHVDHAQECF